MPLSPIALAQQEALILATEELAVLQQMIAEADPQEAHETIIRLASVLNAVGEDRSAGKYM